MTLVTCEIITVASIAALMSLYGVLVTWQFHGQCNTMHDCHSLMSIAAHKISITLMLHSNLIVLMYHEKSNEHYFIGSQYQWVT